MKPILAVIVLYQMPVLASPSYRTLSAMMKHSEPDRFHLTVIDNSPEPQRLPADFVGRYLHDGSNPGLAKRYNEMLTEAESAGATWLLLLDQDTTLTSAYIDELEQLSHRFAIEREIVAIVPKLLEQGRLQSPHLPVYRRTTYSINLETRGVAPGIMRVYNSGALLRVEALRAIGGFPEAYWLDYLDHATFQELQARGGKVYVMDAQLEHEMSIHRPDRHRDPAYAQRQKNQLSAELRFYHEYGSTVERIRHRTDLAQRAFGALKRGLVAESGRLFRALFYYVK